MQWTILSIKSHILQTSFRWISSKGKGGEMGHVVKSKILKTYRVIVHPQTRKLSFEFINNFRM